MLKILLSPLTTATSAGVAFRDFVMVLGAVLTVLGVFGVLTPDQVDALRAKIAILTSPEMLAAIGTVMTLGISIYRNVTKSSSDRAAEAAKEIDKKLPDDMPVVIMTPDGEPDIVVNGDRPIT